MLHDPLTRASETQNDTLATVVETCGHLVAICDMLAARITDIETYIDNLKRGRMPWTNTPF